VEWDRLPADHCWRRKRVVRLGFLPFSFAHETVRIISQSGATTTLRGQGRSRGALYWENDVIDSSNDQLLSIDSFTRRPASHVHFVVQNLTQSPTLPTAARICRQRKR
jgi:hypothetical protein